MKITEFAFIHYPVTDKERARSFYENLLGLVQESAHDFPDGFWMEYAVGTSTLALTNFWKPARDERGPMAALEVEDFNEAIVKLKAAQVTFTMEPSESPVCHQAIVLDPDGNSIMISSPQTAKRLNDADTFLTAHAENGNG